MKRDGPYYVMVGPIPKPSSFFSFFFFIPFFFAPFLKIQHN
jgi:hypothetical protein